MRLLSTKLLATGSSDGSARIIEAATGRELASVAHDRRVSALSWSPDGKLLATGAANNRATGEARIVTIAGTELIRIAHDDWVRAVAWSPDGNMLVIGSEVRPSALPYSPARLTAQHASGVFS